MANLLGIFLTTIFFPVIVASTPDQPIPPTPEQPDPVLVYADNIQTLSGSYGQVLFGLGELTQQLCANPLVIRSPEYTQGANTIVGAIFALRQQLDDLPSPPPVEEVHSEFEAAAKLFVRAAVEINNFIDRHDFDDFVEASDLVTRALTRWQTATDDLERLINEGGHTGGAQAATVGAVAAPSPEIVRYAEEIRQISGAYTEMLLNLGGLTQQLCVNPPSVDSTEFVESTEAIVASIQSIRDRLDAVSSPLGVELLHADFERAGDLFVFASLKIESFTDGHHFDDVADATALVGAALNLWQETNAKLALLLQGSSQ